MSTAMRNNVFQTVCMKERCVLELTSVGRHGEGKVGLYVHSNNLSAAEAAAPL